MKIEIVIIILMQLSNAICNLNISETANKIKTILKRYKNSDRCRRHVVLNGTLEHFVEDTLDFLHRTERLGEYLKYYNVSACVGDARGGNSSRYVKRHILGALLIRDDLPDTHWHEYKSVYNKQYWSEELEETARARWRDNLRRVARHNREYLSGKRSYSLHLNHLGDLDSTNYFRDMLKLIETIPLFDPARDPHRKKFHSNKHRKVPKKMDWRSSGFRPKREEQLHCGACYAFAVAHAMQAQLYKKHGDWRELSPQQIVDCSSGDGNLGCDGGSLAAALRYSARQGLLSETYYPYVGKKGRCRYNALHVSARARRWATLPAGDEAAVEQAVATIGPLAVAVNAEPITFQLYRSGIYDDPFCFPWRLNHAMLLVGYTPQYWVLLNWWGKNWGEDGYIRIRRGSNRCGVANMATYVEL